MYEGMEEDRLEKRFMVGCVLTKTCNACPEQYDVAYNGENIGYLRLRHGHFYAEYVFNGAENLVYSSFTEGDGVFEDFERDYELTRAVTKLLLKHLGA